MHLTHQEWCDICIYLLYCIVDCFVNNNRSLHPISVVLSPCITHFLLLDDQRAIYPDMRRLASQVHSHDVQAQSCHCHSNIFWHVCIFFFISVSFYMQFSTTDNKIQFYSMAELEFLHNFFRSRNHALTLGYVIYCIQVFQDSMKPAFQRKVLVLFSV